MPAELPPRPDGIPLHTAFAAFRARFKTERFPQDNKEAFIGRVTGDFERLARHYFPTELGHFKIDGQTTIGSRYKNADVEYQRTLHSMLGAVILTPTSEDDVAQTTDDVRYQMFTHHQKTDQLSLKNFQEIQRTMFEACPTDTDLGLLLTILSMHDTPKLQTVATRIEAVAGVTSINHDYLLGQMVQIPALYEEIAPNFARLDQTERQRATDIMTSAYNRGQLAQAECSPAQLIAVTRERMTDETNALIKAENTADLAGVTGTLGGIYTNYLHDMYKTADEAVAIVRGAEGNDGILPGYVHVLQKGLARANVDEIVTPDDFMTEVGKRKITIARCTVASKADRRLHDEFTKQFDEMGRSLQSPFQEVFTRTGLDSNVGIMFYYFPAILETCLKDAAKHDPERGLSFGVETSLRLIAQLSILALKHLEGRAIYPTEQADRQTTEGPIEDVFSEVGIRGFQMDRIPEFVFGLDKVVKRLQEYYEFIQVVGQPLEAAAEIR